MNLMRQPDGRRPQEADEANRVGLGRGHERQAMGERPPSRTREESLEPGSASRPRRLDREGAAVKRANFAGQKEVAREEDQHRGA